MSCRQAELTPWNAATDAANLRPGQYRQLRRGQGLGDYACCEVCCPGCGHQMFLNRSVFRVTMEGQCETPGTCSSCGVTWVMRMAGWVPEAAGSA